MIHFAQFRAAKPAAVAALCLFLAACATKPPAEPPYVVLLPNADGSAGQVFVKGSKGEQTLTTAGLGALLDGSAPPFAVPPERISRDFGEAMAARPLAPDRFLLYFQPGSSRLTPESQSLLATIADKVKARPSPDVSVTGHSDTKGTPEGNARLALQRAQAIATLLREQGMEPANLAIESHGDKNLLVPTPDQTDEPRNRRVEVVIR